MQRQSTQLLATVALITTLVVALIASALASDGVVLAATGTDDANATFNGCYYSGYAHYDTSQPNLYATWYTSHLSCADRIHLSSYAWNGTGWDSTISGWQTAATISHYYTTQPTTNIYGYHQIQEPTGTYSPTLETHAN